ncbi:MAG: hypothetical protein HYW65_02960 [Candidatus Liptonbacteria bacterium]|nr:hypothetical protein [Candidatus Liptonbacteria bacterium]
MFEFRKPKVFHWTNHARGKMRYYKLSEQRVRRVLHSPKRVEEGIAPKTVAFMQPSSVSSKWQVVSGKEQPKKQETWRQEIWVMIQDTRSTRKIISAWRYPGMTKPGASLPDAILREVREGAVALSEENLAAREKMSGMLKKWRRTLRG